MSAPIRRWEILLWCLASLLLTAHQLAGTSRPGLLHDSYQYLNIAHHLATQGTAQTSIIHFDEERAQGRIPAPISVFPIGYPALVAGLHLLGLDLEMAAVAISILALLGVLLLIVALARSLGLDTWTTRTALFLWTANSQVPEFSISVLTEPLFTFVSLSILVLFVSGEASSRGSRVFAGFVLAGASYWVRFAGLLVVAAVCLYGALRCLRNQRRKMWVAGVVAAGAIVGAGMLRSFIQTGRWQGGFTSSRFHPPEEVLRTFLSSIYHVVLGNGTVFLPALLVLGVGLLAAVLLVVTYRSSRLPWNAGLPSVFWLYAAVYIAGMLYLGTVSTISFGTRMFFPLLPLLVLSIAAWSGSAMRGLAAHLPRRRALAVAFALAAAGYVFLNVRSLTFPIPPAPHQEVARWLNRPVQDSPTMRDWIQRHIPAGQTVAVSEGQAFAYLTNRPVISLVNSAFSTQVWDEAAVHGTMRHYQASYLVVYPGAPAAHIPVQSQSPFLAALSGGLVPDAPKWLSLAADNGPARVFYCSDCVQAAPPRPQLPAR